MNAMDALFERLRKQGRKALIPFLTAGDPDLAATGHLVDEAIRRGADLVEIGFPYSDPLADGPVIQASYTRSLRAGITLEKIFTAAASWSAANAGTPLVAMVSYSLIFRRGPEAFLDRAKPAGFAGLIVPDLPMEHAEPLAAAAQHRELKLIQLVTPTTPRDRARQIAQFATGFLYVVSVTGITGARDVLPAALTEQLAWLRTQTKLPLCVGFGISTPDQVRRLKSIADGVIVGSALIKHLEGVAAGGFDAARHQLGTHLAELRRALDE